MPPARRPEALRGRIFRKPDVVGRGLLTPSELRSSAWRRLYRGVYADAELPDSLDLRIGGAGLLVPRAAVFAGRTAAYLHGATELADTRGPVEVTVPAGVRFGPVGGLRVRQAPLPATDVAVLRGRRCTAGLRTALDIARHEPVIDAVAALDVLLARALVGTGELSEVAAAATAAGPAGSAAPRNWPTVGPGRCRSRGCESSSPRPVCTPFPSSPSATPTATSSRGSTWPFPS